MPPGPDKSGRSGALERGDGGPHEPLAQLGDALGGVGAVALAVDAAELVVGQAATGKEVVSTGADMKANTSGAVAHSRLVIFVSLRMAASAVAPWALMLLPPRLRARGRMGTVRACQWALTQKQTLRGGGALEVGDLRLIEDGSKRSDALVSDAVASETVSKGQDGKR